MTVKRIFFIALIFSAGLAFSQEVTLSYNGSGAYRFRERSDLRRYDNGKYTGLVSREVGAYIIPFADKDGFLYEGDFFVLQETRRALLQIGEGVDGAVPAVFRIGSDGTFSMERDNGYPSFRSFPSFPRQKIRKGDSWEAAAERCVDPLGKGVFTRLPMYVSYTYMGDQTFNGEDVYLLTAKWATRYGGTSYDPSGDQSLVKASGMHSATIYISKATGNAVVVRDTVDEQFSYADGTLVAFKGTISLFTEYPPTVKKEKILPALDKVAVPADKNPGKGGNPDISYETTPAGIRLTMQNLRFKPDSAQLLDGEKVRLDDIAGVLKEAAGSQFLVEGHTASTGDAKGELELSVERARTIVDELVRRGIDSSRFIYKGSGGTKPVADNATAEGKAKNRRVEITILE